MKFYSTRDAQRLHPHTLKEAAFLGLAPDGGLFMPELIPHVDKDEILRLADKSYADMAIYLAGLFFADDVPMSSLEAMVRRAYDFDCPLVELAPSAPDSGSAPTAAPVRTLQLFHGPTFAFKDFGARFMGGMLGLLNNSGDDLVVLTATSGDTGSAVAAGFYKVPGVRVVVLYPEGKVSPLQEAQMTTLGENIFPVCVNGNFDDCQALVKAVFNDSEFRSRMNVTSANSINLLRWIPQSFYYWYGWSRLGGRSVDVVVPSGNYGNITAGMLAAAMGMPVRRFIAASNANDVVPQFLASGEYHPRASVRTLANAMDVGAPSNYERMMYLVDNDFGKLTSVMEGYSYSDSQIQGAIRELLENRGYWSDPHSAIGYMAYRDSAADGFYLSTAHAAKFSEVIEAATGRKVELPDALKSILSKDRRCHHMANDLSALEEYIAQ